MSAVTSRAKIMNTAHSGGLDGTYAGNPQSVAAANAVLDVIDDEKLSERAAEIGRRITDRLTSLASRQGMERIGDVRRPGAMITFELVEDRQTKTAAPAMTNRIVAEAEARGCILLSCGARLSVIRLLPPLTIEWEFLSEGLDTLGAAIEAASSVPSDSAAA
ncbi:aminotransferase class III-fold pyridoxal phosphate-dependent enzyme [Agrobacterium arsenijevicii]|uniref:aminotransferase class III-fold pyridoxal phosphate-dependent enzyme n=1 Tax=Agrobacterium arsenijevicii TaxID=1585697 RepID=UPI0033059FD3